MVKISWCKRKTLRFTSPNNTLAKEFLRKSSIAFETMQQVESKEWKVIAGSYACYNALYALLQRAGIVSGIHDCTIELMSYFGFNKIEKQFIVKLKQQRENAQYFVDRELSKPDKLKIKRFILSCSKKFEQLDFENIRNKLEK